jgi:2-polyprenyl-3-methyl-5-hydroxy-6-metoxy-1,4-benzoquinol methylase
VAALGVPHYGGIVNLADANDPRTRIVNMVPDGGRVLEVGCGSGTISGYLARAKGCRVLAIEPDAIMADAARRIGIAVVQASIEAQATQADLALRGPFDAIVFADVLEHLRDPWRVLRAVRGWLAPDGVVLASVPNVAHWSVRLALLAGRWDYTGGYLMDRTHLRWFTRESLHRLFVETGFQVTEMQTRWAAFPGDTVWRRLIPGRERLYAGLAHRWPGFFGYQFVVRARIAP